MVKRKDRMKLSIIIICWNDAECLGPCLASLLTERPPFDFEVIVTDNGSTDGSRAIVESQRTEDKRVHLLTNGANLGFGPGNNAGAEIARGKYLFFLNPDTIVHPGALAGLVKFLETHPGAGMVGPRVLNLDGSFQLSAHPLPSFSRFLVKALRIRRLGYLSESFPADEYMGWKGDKTRTVGYLAACAVALRADLFRKLGGFDAAFKHQYEDADLCCRIWKRGLPVYFYPGASITHIRGVNRGRYPLSVLEKAEHSKFTYFAKHFGRTGLLRAICILHCSLRTVGLYLTGNKERARIFGSLLAMHLRSNNFVNP
jgi:GT2 family glycosyltransferase